MIDLDFLQSLIKAIDESSLDNIEIERGGTRIRLAKTPSQGAGVAVPVAHLAPSAPPALQPMAPPAVAAAAPVVEAEDPTSAAGGDADLIEIKSPMVGTFYRSPAPDASAYVSVGATVGPGDTLCIIEAMKLMNELECEVSGVIREICVESADPVEYGQVLFRLAP